MQPNGKVANFILFLQAKYGAGDSDRMPDRGQAQNRACSLPAALEQVAGQVPEGDIEDKVYDQWRREFLDKHDRVLQRLHEKARSLDRILADIEAMPPRGPLKKYPLWRAQRRAEAALESVELTPASTAKLVAGALLAAMFLVGIAPDKTHNTFTRVNQALFEEGRSAKQEPLANIGGGVVSSDRLSSYVKQFHNTRSALGLGKGVHGETVSVPEKDLKGEVAGAYERQNETREGAGSARNMNFFEFVYQLFFKSLE